MQRVIALLAPLLDVEPNQLSAATTSDDVDTWDSLATINLALALEEEFAVTLSADDVESLSSVQAIALVLRNHGVALAS